MVEATNNLAVHRVQTLAQVLGTKWGIAVMRTMLGGRLRFSELRAALPDVTTKVLTQELRRLECLNLVKRTQYLEIPPRVEYELTQAALELAPALAALCAWAEIHLPSVVSSCSQRSVP